MTEPTNADHADYAQRALEFYAREKGFDPIKEGFETAVRDLLSDLMHFCEQEGIDYDHEHDVALMNFDAELAKEE